MFRINNLSVVTVGFCALLVLTFPVAGRLLAAEGDAPLTEAEKKAQEEAKEAEQEMMEAAKNGQPTTLSMSGMLSLYAAPNPDQPGVAGTFVVGDQTFLLKLSDEDLKKKLEPLHGKSVTLMGSTSNKGKYFNAIELVQGGGVAPKPKRAKRGGL